MKKLKLSLIIFLVCAVCFAQIPEEKQAKKMMDSMMATLPADQKAFMEQMMSKGKEVEKQRKAKKAAEKKKQRMENERLQKLMRSETKSKENADSYYWKNKIASTTQGKFNNWSFGKADIKIRFSKGWNKPADYLKIGEISAKGQVTISLPEIDFRKWAKTPITNAYSEGDDLFYDLNKTLEYSNKNVTYFASRYGLSVMQGDKDLGTLNVANSVVTLGNLNAPCCMHKGGDGYIAYWVYMSHANTVKEKVSNPNLSVDTNLEFKKGWNIVITRVKGKKEGSYREPYQLGEWKNKYHTAMTTMPADAKYYFSSPLVEDKY